MGMEQVIGRIIGTGEQLMLIDGKRVPAASGRTINVYDPSTGTLIGTSPDGDVEDIDRAVQAASRTFESGVWRTLHGSERERIMWRAAELLEKHAQELAELEALNSGMLLPMAQQMMAGAVNLIRYFAGWATKIHGLTSEISGPHGQFHAYTLREPIGVCGAIIPWNVPVVLTVTKIAPALATGCSIVIKPSEETPLTALRLAEIFAEAGVPDGVINIVTGCGHTAGAALAAHEKIAKIAFTGSTEVGKLIVKAAAGNLKRVTLELGGKSPVVVFDDCDYEKTIVGAAMGVFLHAGQICIAGSRLYVQRKSFDKVIAGIAGIAEKMKIGSCFDPETQVGPLISAKQMDRVTGLIASGLDEGAEIVTGGKRVGNTGYFIQPTIMINPDPGARIVREEIFGPVLTAMPFDDIDEIAKEANDTTYGLASAVWTKDISKAHLLAKKLQAGFVWINCEFVSDPSLPGGGYKQSGWGREMGQEGLDAYLQTKSVFAAL
ncbi:MAG TPA: aldehyde dehydrogenase family protein [Rhizomicrobium sp.]|nr:aldehyde dehydrogenase family protein [Rhizomicrobium sp.]